MDEQMDAAHRRAEQRIQANRALKRTLTDFVLEHDIQGQVRERIFAVIVDLDADTDYQQAKFN